MIGAALYVLVVSVFLCVGAWLAERILASLRWPRRGVWLAAMLLSIAIPAWHLPEALPDMSPVQITVPPSVPVLASTLSTVRGPRGAPGSAETAVARSASTKSAPPPAHGFWTATVYHRLVVLFLASWAVASAVFLVRLLVGAVALRRRSRHWTSTVLDGVAVTISDKLGPAVLGIIRPRILVPRWLAEEPAPRRSAVLTHESEHLRARDAYLLLGGWLLLVLLPWNLFLWWLWRRLKLAIEMDCDARVVRRGAAPASYGEELLAIATRTPPVPRSAIGLFERRSQLARRVRILATPSRRWWRWAAVPLYAVTGLAALAAATFPAPPIDAALGARNQAHQNAVQLQHERAREARARARLLANGQPNALAAASILGWPWPTGLRAGHKGLVRPPNAAQRLAWLRRAVHEAPRSDLVVLEIGACKAWKRHCDVAALLHQDYALDPGNGVVWLNALAAAAAAKDSKRIDATLSAIGHSTRVETYYTRLVGRLTDALHRIGAERIANAYIQAANALQNTMLPVNGFIAFSAACNPGNHLTTQRLHLCRKASVTIERGDSLLSSQVGSQAAIRLWPVGTPEHRHAVAMHRRLDYMEAQSQRLMLPPGHRLRALLALLDGQYWTWRARLDMKYPSEQAVLRAELIHAGLNPNPPAGWKDPEL